MDIHYGKAEVSTYRTYAQPLEGLRAIPESPFTGRPNVLLSAAIDVQVLGEAFAAAYTEGDNSMVVATDTMKNFIHRESLTFAGSTLEGWLAFLGRRFLETYPQMERLRVSAEELRFDPVRVPTEGGGFEPSSVLLQRHHDDHGVAMLDLARGQDGRVDILDLRSGRVGLDLLKVTGSSFAAFARDQWTTLPERPDRLLYTNIDISWRYDDPLVAVAPHPERYVAHEQVADLAAVTFHSFVSLSIQHLVHEIGQRMLERFPTIVEVGFEAENRTLDLAETSADEERVKVYTDPRPPYGRIGLTLHRE
jgi:urate oxidase